MGPYHHRTQEFVRQLNHFYLQHPPLWQLDYDHRGFSWLDLEDQDNSIISFMRASNEPDDYLVCVLNFTPQTLEDYKIGVPELGEYQLVFCSDEARFGGSGVCPEIHRRAVDEPFARAPYHVLAKVPPLAGLILKPSAKENK